MVIGSSRLPGDSVLLLNDLLRAKSHPALGRGCDGGREELVCSLAWRLLKLPLGELLGELVPWAAGMLEPPLRLTTQGAPVASSAGPSSLLFESFEASSLKETVCLSSKGEGGGTVAAAWW